MSFFREMSIQVLCSLFNWVVLCHWALGVLYMCWISASHLIHSRMICNYFSHSRGRLFTLLILSFDTKVFNFDERQLIFLVAYAFHVVSKIIAKSTSMKSFPCVFFKEFYSFSSNIYVCGSFWVRLSVWCEVKIQLHLPARGHPDFPPPFAEALRLWTNF